MAEPGREDQRARPRPPHRPTGADGQPPLLSAHYPEPTAAGAALLSRTSCPIRRPLINVIYLVLRVVRRYLFPDVLPFLQAAKTNGVRLYLLSFGSDEWQRYKVTASHLGSYFDDSFFTAAQGGKAKLIQEHADKIPQEALVVVDNNPNELDLIKDAAPGIQTYYMNRVPDDLRSPSDDLSRRKFLEARRYLGEIPRHRHTRCKSLDSIAFEVKSANKVGGSHP